MTRNDYLIEIFGSTLTREIYPILIKQGKQVKTINDTCKFASKWVFFLAYDSAIHTIKNRSKEIRDLLIENNLENLVDIFKLESSIYGLLKNNYKEKVKEDLKVSNLSEDKFNHLDFAKNKIAELQKMIKEKDLDLDLLIKPNKSFVVLLI